MTDTSKSKMRRTKPEIEPLIPEEEFNMKLKNILYLRDKANQQAK